MTRGSVLNSAPSGTPELQPRRVATASAVALGLEVEEGGVAAALGDELIVGAALDDVAVVEHDDLVRHADGREPVRDDDRDLVVRELAEALEDLDLGLGVHRRGGLVE